MASMAAYFMVYIGAALMVYNIACYFRFARFIQNRETHRGDDADLHERHGILYVPTVLLVLFLLGYLAIGLFGNPDLVIGCVLLGGSIFVFIMYKLMGSITDRVIKNEQFEAQFIAAEESNRAKASFLASVSHEMRTPLNVILGLDGMALKNPDVPSDAREQLERIGLNAHHLLDLINNVLDINRIEAGELAAVREEFCMRDIWEQLNAIAWTLCENKGVTYRTSIDDGAAGWYVGDATMIKQVLVNILDNAAKYTDAPGTVTFAVENASSEGFHHIVRFSVADTGVGIDPDYLDKIFDAFEQEDASSTSRFSGCGLGLATSKAKIDLMGGDIDVQSEKGAGSTFTVTLPLAPSDRQADAEQLSDGDADDAILEGALILIVEDVDDNAEIVADLLELEGAESERAENGLVALEMFEASPVGRYDAVLMDLRMPVMDGLESTRRIRALDRPDAKTVPILALTANAYASDVQQSLDAGMNVHLAKPTDADQLYATLKRLIRQTRE